MTKNRSIKIAVLVLALALITSCFVGTTFAKYQSTGSATGTLTVAKWDVSFADQDISAEYKTKTIDLFTTIKDNGGDDDATTEDDVAEGKIAPGTKGAFDLVIVNNSEVSAAYDVKFTVTNPSNVPLTFKVNGVVNANLATNATGNITLAAIDADPLAKTATITVEWEWAFDGDVATDTAIGAYDGEAPVVTIKADATITQIN